MQPEDSPDTERIASRQLEIDRKILRELLKGRCTPGYLADKIDEQQPYVSRRLGELDEDGLVEKIHRGLWTPTDKLRPEGRDE